MKRNSSGTLQWQKKFFNVSGKGVAVGPDNSIYFLGQPSGGKMWIGKLNAAGTLQWQATWSSTDSSTENLSRSQIRVSNKSIYIANKTT